MDIDFMEIDGNYFKKIFFFKKKKILFSYMVNNKIIVYLCIFFFSYKYRFFEIVCIIYRYIYII